MWLPFFNKQATDTDKLQEPSIPTDIQNYLQEHEPTITEREFESSLKTSTNVSKLAPAPTVESITGLQKQKKEIIDESRLAFQQKNYQPIDQLTKEQIKEKTELDAYRRENPMLEAVLENCSEIQLLFFDCLANGSIEERLKGCNTKQNFHQECVQKQLLIFKMFDYDSIDKIRQLDEVRGISDVVFNRYFKDYSDLMDDEKSKLYQLDLKKKRERFYEKYGK